MAGRDEMPRCDHGKCEDEGCADCLLVENDLLRERVDALCERLTALEAEVARLDRVKCTHKANAWNDACVTCADSVTFDKGGIAR
jgi:dynactin complex subunit